MKKINLLVLIVLSFILCSCAPTPPPEQAIKECMDKGWKPYYHSSGTFTKFKCLPPDDFSEAPFDYREFMYKKENNKSKMSDSVYYGYE